MRATIFYGLHVNITLPEDLETEELAIKEFKSDLKSYIKKELEGNKLHGITVNRITMFTKSATIK